MTRRDTIIVAALINTGLLIVLFVSALKNEEGREEISYRKEETELATTLPPPAFSSEVKRVAGDEVDEVLKQYAKVDPLEPAKVETTLPASSSFAEEMKAITTPSVLDVKKETVEASSEQVPSHEEVKVKKGDVLEKIARHHHTTVSDIMKLNGLSSTQLKIGQVLKVPAKAKKEVVEKQEAPLEPTSAKYYTVKPGDNPWTIAVKNHIKVEELLKLNNMNEEKARKLKPGDQIRIR